MLSLPTFGISRWTRQKPINSQLEDRRMRDFDAALRHHLDEIPIRQPIADIPTHAQLDDGSVERSLAVERVTVNRLRHSAPLQGPRILPDGPGCTRTHVRTFALTLRCPRSSACRLTALAVSLACDILHAGLSTRRRLFARGVQGDAKFHRGAKAPETLLRKA